MDACSASAKLIPNADRKQYRESPPILNVRSTKYWADVLFHQSCLLRASIHHFVHVFDDIKGIRYKSENVNNNIPKWIVHSTKVKFPSEFFDEHFHVLSVSCSVRLFVAYIFVIWGQII